MKAEELKKGTKVWCWWKSRYLWFSGVVRDGVYEFRDVCDVVVRVAEEDLGNLERRD